MSNIVFCISDQEGADLVLHVEINAASGIEFDLNFEGLDYDTVIADLCAVARPMMRLDVDLMEAYDDAFRTQPKRKDQVAVALFIQKYHGRIPQDLAEQFS